MKKLAATLAALGLAGVLVGFTATPDSAPKPVSRLVVAASLTCTICCRTCSKRSGRGMIPV